jgi:hypothetical protein
VLKHSREPRRHHYVPEFILRPWVKEWQPDQALIRGYYWDERSRCIRYRDKGVGAFCYRIDLLTLKNRREGRAILESRFFQAIDDKGKVAVDALLARGPEGLTNDERCDFVRLLLSLEYRRPAMVNRLRNEGAAQLMAGLDNAPDLLAEMQKLGIDSLPSEYARDKLAWSFEERALLIVQDLVDSRAVGERVANAHWYLKRLRREHGSLLLSDRPLVRTHGLDHQASTWFLPLSPKVGFFATLHHANLRLIQKASATTIVRHANIDAAGDAEKYVFSVESHFPSSLARILATPKPETTSSMPLQSNSSPRSVQADH